MTSWVETTCPPGWGVMEESDVHWSVYCCEPCGDDRFVAEVWGPLESANRLAWERWALDVLGDRLRWRKCDETGCAWVDAGPGDAPFVDSRTDGMYVVHSRHGTEFVEDTVEALVRLAAIVVAQLGPIGQDTDGTSIAQGVSDA